MEPRAKQPGRASQMRGVKALARGVSFVAFASFTDSAAEPGPVQFDTHRWGVGGDISHKLNSVEFRGIRGLGPEVGT